MRVAAIASYLKQKDKWMLIVIRVNESHARYFYRNSSTACIFVDTDKRHN